MKKMKLLWIGLEILHFLHLIVVIAKSLHNSFIYLIYYLWLGTCMPIIPAAQEAEAGGLQVQS